MADLKDGSFQDLGLRVPKPYNSFSRTPIAPLLRIRGKDSTRFLFNGLLTWGFGFGLGLMVHYRV